MCTQYENDPWGRSGSCIFLYQQESASLHREGPKDIHYEMQTLLETLFYFDRFRLETYDRAAVSVCCQETSQYQQCECGVSGG